MTAGWPVADTIAHPISGWASISAYSVSSEPTTSLCSSQPTVSGSFGTRWVNLLAARTTTMARISTPSVMWTAPQRLRMSRVEFTMTNPMNNALKTSTAVSQCRMRVRTGYRARCRHRRNLIDLHDGRRFRFTRPGPIRRRVHGRSGAQQWIVRRLDSVWQHQRIEVDIAGVSGPFCLDIRQGEHSGVDGATVARPRQGGIEQRIARAPDRSASTATAAGRSAHLPDQCVEQRVLRAGSRRLRRLQRDERPPNRSCARPASLTKKKVFRPAKVLSAKPGVGGCCLITAMAAAVSGWAARNADIAAGSGFPVAGIDLRRQEPVIEALR